MRDQPGSVVGVRFRNAGKVFYFDAAGIQLESGEYVIVETVRGPEIAKVIIAPGQVVVNELRDDLRPILRLATDDDIRRMDTLRKKAAELLPEARRLADDARFPARIDAADYTLDGRRLTFSFTSEERLDYRDFLRRAGDRFGAKIDMRQMGGRDRAKLAGGYGICGRELCCSGWLTTFPSISIRMAKEQDLPLNPQKISGLCGRLLCCLSYEEQGYKEMRKSLPKLGQRCSTPTGEGKVIGVNILKRSVMLVIDGQRVEINDRELGTVVRWDTASKIGAPPPSISRAEAIAQGLLEATEEDLREPVVDGEDVDWITGQATVRSEPGPGRGRLPGGGPRKQGRAARPPADAPNAPPPGGQRGRPPQGTPRDRQQQAQKPQEPRQGAPRRNDQPSRPDAVSGAATRVFKRADPPPPARDANAAPNQPSPPPGARQGAPRRQRRDRPGPRDGPADSSEPPT